MVALPIFQPETAQFKQELASPIQTLDGRTGSLYATHLQGEASPVVLNLPYSQRTDNRLGIAVLNAYAQNLDHPIVVMDMLGTGQSSQPGQQWENASIGQAAASEARALRTLGIEKASFVGTCLGGVMAYHKARIFGKDALHLATVSSPGYRRLPVEQATEFAASILYEDDKSRELTRVAMRKLNLAQSWRSQMQSPPLTAAAQALQNRLFLSVASTNSLSTMAYELAPETRVTDITVLGDMLTDAKDHQLAIARRNYRHPNSSTSIVLDEPRGHAFTTYYAPAIAQLINLRLAA